MPRTILITGASGNLGKEVVNLFHAEGHTLLATWFAHEPDASLKQKIKHLQQVNLQSEEETHAAIQSMLLQFPDLDAAVLLAGGYEGGNISATNAMMLDNQMRLNFHTAWNVVKPLEAHFKKQGRGQFVFMGSRPAISPEGGKSNVAYALSKSLLFNLAEIINAEGKASGITASMVVPSIMDTPQNRKSIPDADFKKWVSAEDVAATISFILSDVGQQMRQPVYKIYNKA